MKFCTNCGNECKLDMKFCARCGSKLVESEAIAPPPSEETAEAVEVVEAPSVTTNPPAQEEMTEHNDEDASVTNDTDADVSDTYDANNATDIGSSDGEGEAIDVGANDMRDFDMSSAPLQVLPSDDSVVDAESDAEDAEDNSPPVASSLSDESHSVEPSLSKPLPAPVFSSANAPVSSFSPVGAAEDAGLLHLEDGTILQGDYVVGKLLGAGSFGATYAGWDRAGNQAIAIREYLPAEFATRVQSQISVFNDSRKQKQFHDGLVKFLEEAKQISKLQGEDGVISIYDYFEANNTAYIVMEHLEGSLLSEKPNRKFDPTVAVDFMMPIINSLEMLHDAGIYHLDIAPNNVFMTLDGRVKLIDFSAYRHVTTSHSRSLSVLVKAGFSAEELYRSNGDLGAHTDVYSLGAMLYRLLTGEVPPDAMSRRMNLENGNPDPLMAIRKINPQVTKSQENAILNALNVQIEDRTPDVATFAEELHSEDTKRRGQKVSLLDIGKLPRWVFAAVGVGAAALLVLIIMIASGFFSPRGVTSPEGMVIVPSVINMAHYDAGRELDDLSLQYMIIGREFSAAIPPGFVLLQDITAGTLVELNTLISLTVSGGTAMGLVPFVEGISAEDAEAEMYAAGFEVRFIYEYSRFIVAGAVIRQDVESNSEHVLGDTIRLYVSRGPDPESDEPHLADVPDVVGLSFDQATQLARDAGFAVEVLQRRYGTETRYEVVYQSLTAGTRTMTYNTMGLVISLGARMALVPDVQFLTLEEAEEMILEAGFGIQISMENNDSVARGNVISQYPATGSHEFGITVSIVVSEGGIPFVMPNVANHPIDSARTVLVDAGLTVVVNHTNHATIQEGIIITQDPASGAQVTRGDTVYLVVSSGERIVTVPANLEGMSRVSAENALTAAGLQFTVFENPHETIAAGNVISFSPSGNQPENTLITLVVSTGRETITIPTYLVGMPRTSAEARIISAGLVPQVTLSHSDTVPTGMVIAQSPTTGTLFRGDTLAITVSQGAEEILVPNVVGQSRAAAENSLQSQGFVVNIIEERESDTVAAGNVILQFPIAGQRLARGNAVGLVISSGQTQRHYITYNANGGTGTMARVSVRHGTHHFASHNQFTRANFVFSGWNTQANGNGLAFSSGARIDNIQAPMTLYAQWVAGQQHTITYVANGASGTMPAISVPHGANHIVSWSSFTHPQGHTFGGWNTQSNGGGATHNSGTTISNIQTNIRLYAQWIPAIVPVESITISYAPQSPVAGTPVTLSATVTPINAANQTITWSVLQAGTTSATISGNTLNTSATGTVTIRATIVNGISTNPQINFTHDIAITIRATERPVIVTGGTANFANASVGEVVTVTAGTPPTGQQFARWTAGAGVNFANAYSPTTTFVMPNLTAMITANWEPLPPEAFTITVNGGNASLNQATQGQAVTITAGTPPAGQRFASWTATPHVAISNPSNPTTTFTMPNNAITITANWEIIPAQLFAITVTGGTSNPSQAEQGQVVTITAGTPPAGQQFASWSTSPAVTLSNATNPTTTFVMPNNPITVTANWEPIPIPTFPITITGGTANPNTAEQGQTITITASALVAGQQFSHWTATPAVSFANANSQTTTFTMPNNPVTITANWTTTAEPEEDDD